MELVFVPTAKKTFFIIHEPQSLRISISRNPNTRIKNSRIGTKLWNEIPTKLRALPKANLKKKIQMLLLNNIGK